MAATADPAQVVTGLVGAVKNLTSDANYKLIADVFGEVLSLKDQNDRLTLSHRETLEEYRKFRNELEANEAGLQATKAALEATVREKEAELEGLSDLKGKLEEELEVTKATLEDVGGAKAKLEEALEDSKATLAEVEEARTKLEADLDTSKTALAEVEEAKTNLKEAKAKVEEELGSSKAALADIGEAKVKLEEELEVSKATLADVETAKAKSEEELSSCQTALAELEVVKTRLDADLTDTTARLEEAQSAKAKLDEDLAQTSERLEEQQKRAEEATEEVANLQGELAERDAEVGRLKEDLQAAEEKAAEVAASAQELQKRVDEATEDLQVRNARLAELEGFRATLRNEPEDTYVTILDTIWTAVFELVESHFRRDLDVKVLADPSCWSNLRNSEYLKRPTAIPLPPSNSPAAKAMRIAAVLAVLSRTLHRHVFRPAYLIDDDAELAQLLRDVEHDSPAREEHARATLLAMLPERQLASARKRAQAVVRDVSWVVQHLLGSLQYDTFCSGLVAVCELACQQWRRVQEARMKIEPYFGPPYDEFDWQVLPLAEFDQHHHRRSAICRLENGHGGVSTRGVITPPSSDTAVEDRHSDGEAPTDEKIDKEDAGEEAVVDDDDDEEEGNDDDEPDAGGDASDSDESEMEPDNILLVVWPTMCAVEEGELASITQGLVISKDQARGAIQEVRMRLGPRPNSKRARSMSIPSHSISTSPVPGKAFLLPADGDVSASG